MPMQSVSLLVFAAAVTRFVAPAGGLTMVPGLSNSSEGVLLGTLLANASSAPRNRSGLQPGTPFTTLVKATAIHNTTSVAHNTTQARHGSPRHNLSVGLQQMGSVLEQEAMFEANMAHAFRMELEYELDFERTADMVRDKRWLALIEGLGFGFCGVDRCFLGQRALGIVKGLTLGGLFVWFAIDYIFVFVSCFTKADEINDIGFNASFTSGTVEPAFWIFIACFCFKCSVAVYRNCCRQRSRQPHSGRKSDDASSGGFANTLETGRANAANSAAGRGT